MAKTQAATLVPTPFAGFAGPGSFERVVSDVNLLVLGLSGRGKTRKVLAPAALVWAGPVVISSSKRDFFDLVYPVRVARGGTVYLLDLGGEVEETPPGVVRVYVDPTAMIDGDSDDARDDAALDLAARLLAVANVGSGSGKIGGGSGDDGPWSVLATAPLAALLRAAGPDGVDWALRAVGRPQGEDDEDEETPSWTEAYARIEGHSRHAVDLLSLINQEERTRDSVMITMKTGIASWARSTVRGGPDAHPFHPSLLSDPRATLAMIAPGSGVAAGAAVATIAQITDYYRRNFASLHRLLMLLDEFNNSTPLPMPMLNSIVSEMRGMKICPVLSAQSSDQMQLRYGRDAETIVNLFTAHLILEGSPEFALLRRACEWGGQAEVWSESIDHAGKRSRSSELRDRYQPIELAPKSRSEGRLLLGGKAGVPVSLRDISELRLS